MVGKNTSQRLWAVVRWASNAEREGKTMSSQEYTATHKDQKHDKETGNGGGRQKLKHVDGDFPWGMRGKSENNEAKTRKWKLKR